MIMVGKAVNTFKKMERIFYKMISMKPQPHMLILQNPQKETFIVFYVLMTGCLNKLFNQINYKLSVPFLNDDSFQLNYNFLIFGNEKTKSGLFSVNCYFLFKVFVYHVVTTYHSH